MLTHKVNSKINKWMAYVRTFSLSTTLSVIFLILVGFYVAETWGFKKIPKFTVCVERVEDELSCKLHF